MWLRQPIKCRQFTFINFDIYFGGSIHVMQKLVFCQLSRYVCTRRIQSPFKTSMYIVVSFSDNDDVICCFYTEQKKKVSTFVIATISYIELKCSIQFEHIIHHYCQIMIKLKFPKLLKRDSACDRLSKTVKLRARGILTTTFLKFSSNPVL